KPSQPEEPNYDKAMASLAEAIQNKSKELGSDKEAKKKLVELSEQALTAIQEAKTQDAVDKALQAALTSINQLQATPKEDPKPEEPAQPEESKINYDKAMASLAEAIQNKSKELGSDKEAKKKLVELSEQALTAIQEAKTQDAVDKVLQAALTSINQLQATPKEEVKHSIVPTDGDKELVQPQPSLEVVEKVINFKKVKQEDSSLPKGETRVTQVGRAGKERILTEVAPDGSRTIKLREVIEVAQDEIVLVGTKKEESSKIVSADHKVPEFTGGVSDSEAAIHNLPEFTGGVSGSEAAIHNLPEFTGGVSDSEAAIHNLPEFTGGVSDSEAAIHNLPEFTGGVSGSEAAIHNLPEFTGSMTGSEGVTHGVSNVEEGVPSGEAASHQESGFTSDVTASEKTMNEIVDKNDEKSYVVPPMLEDKTYQAPANRQEVLPKTGSEDGSAFASVGIMGMFLGMIGMVKRKKD
ncbi:SIALI-17 repeat-containing surface protein, partial [Streptococcus mitis]|uniref:SIALI-17 repeat-containing surface protein n=1 Tax=Streptococcus mitis TaxID=28037 RepID=UPI0039C0A539